MKHATTFVAVPVYAVFLGAVFDWADCRILLLACGLGGVLLLDRHTFRRLGWPKSHGFGATIPWLVGIVAAVALAKSGYGYLEWCEIIFVGLLYACTAALLQWVSYRLSRARQGRRRIVFALLPWFIALAAAVFFAPAIAATHPPRRIARDTPAALGLAFENVEFTASDGFLLRGWFVPADHARGSAIFCHGITANRGHAIGFIPTLHEMGLNVLAFDFRAHGESDGHTVCFGAREVEDVVAAHDYIARRVPGRPIVLMGSSYGAAVVLQSLHRLPDLAAAWADASFARFSDVADQDLRRWPPAIRHALLWIYSIAVWADSGVWLWSINPVDQLAGVRVPITFVHGRSDQRIPFSQAEALYAAYPGPKQCFWVDGADHFNLFNISYKEYLPRMQAFFNQHIKDTTNY